MAHELEGNKAFYVTQPAWHNLGTVLVNAPTIEEAWKLAYPHTLFKLGLDAVINRDDPNSARMPLTKSAVIMRDDGTEYNTVGADFELVQPIEILETFRPLLESGLVKLEAGGSLRGGSQMWALAKVEGADADIVKGDHVKGYVLMYTGFDGSLRVGVSQTNTRVVCANTLASSIAETKGANNSFKFKHTKNVRLRTDNAMQAIKSTLEAFKETTAVYSYLASVRVTAPQMKAYIRHVLLTPEEIKLSNDGKLSTKRQNTVDHVIDLLDQQRGLDLVPAIRGTAWQAYNAVTEYLTHDACRTADTRVHSAWFGDNSRLNEQALALATNMQAM